MTNFAFSQQYDKTLQYIGYFPYYEEEFIIGDPKTLDFLALYGVKDQAYIFFSNNIKNKKNFVKGCCSLRKPIKRQ